MAHFHTLPDTPYDLWVRGELAAHLHLPDDGTRVEVVGGEIVVSPGPTLDHNFIVGDVQRALLQAELTDPAFPWRTVQTTDLNLARIGDGYVPDLLLITTEVAAEARKGQFRFLLPHHVDLVVEVTSRSTAVNDREPRRLRPVSTKWSGYASTGIPYYLLVDRDPTVLRTTLYADPDVHAATYRSVTTWKFGMTVQLPEPFGVEIVTDEWQPWPE